MTTINWETAYAAALHEELSQGLPLPLAEDLAAFKVVGEAIETGTRIAGLPQHVSEKTPEDIKDVQDRLRAWYTAQSDQARAVIAEAEEVQAAWKKSGKEHLPDFIQHVEDEQGPEAASVMMDRVARAFGA